MFFSTLNRISKSNPVSVENRFAIADATTLTLDGQPAKANGVFKDECHVWQIGTPWKAAAFSWETVEKAWNSGGDLKS